MISKLLLLALLLIISIGAKSQILLNSDSTKINKQIIFQGGILMRNRLTADGIRNPIRCYLLSYKFSPTSSTFAKDGINMMLFYLTLDNKCYRYYVSYINEPRYLNRLIAKLNKSNASLIPEKDSIWVDIQKKYTIHILKPLTFHGNTSQLVFVEFSPMKN